MLRLDCDIYLQQWNLDNLKLRKCWIFFPCFCHICYVVWLYRNVVNKNKFLAVFEEKCDVFPHGPNEIRPWGYKRKLIYLSSPNPNGLSCGINEHCFLFYFRYQIIVIYNLRPALNTVNFYCLCMARPNLIAMLGSIITMDKK